MLTALLVLGAVVLIGWSLRVRRGEYVHPQRPLTSAHRALTSTGEAELRRLLAARRKIEAIRRYRELTGAGLKEAKEAVERLARVPGPGRGRPG